MKRFISMMLVLALLMVPAASLAESNAVTYKMDDIAITMDLPGGWFTATPKTADLCSLGIMYQMSGAEIREMLSAMNASLYAVCDNFGVVQMAVIGSPGIGIVDMRNDKLNMNAFMKGFLYSYNSVKESGVYKTDASTFAWVRYEQDDPTGTIDTIQFVTCTNGTLYVIQFMSFYGIAFGDDMLDTFRQVVSTIRFA